MSRWHLPPCCGVSGWSTCLGLPWSEIRQLPCARRRRTKNFPCVADRRRDSSSCIEDLSSSNGRRKSRRFSGGTRRAVPVNALARCSASLVSLTKVLSASVCCGSRNHIALHPRSCLTSLDGARLLDSTTTANQLLLEGAALLDALLSLLIQHLRDLDAGAGGRAARSPCPPRSAARRSPQGGRRPAATAAQSRRASLCTPSTRKRQHAAYAGCEAWAALCCSPALRVRQREGASTASRVT